MESGTDGGLVGRGAELAVLRSTVDRAAAGGGAAVLVLGEAGIGKSRLLAEAAQRARAAGMEVLAGRAVAGGGAFRAVAVALADRLRSQDDAGRGDGGLLADERLRGFLPALRRLLPTATMEGAPDEPGPDGADPVVVAGEGVLRLLGLLAADRGCLLLLEDLHWADADTLALVEYLAAAAGSAGVLLVASARDEGVGRGALARLVRVPTATVLRPRRLTPREMAALVAARTPDLPADRVDAVVAAADGLPLLVEELATGLRQDLSGDPPTASSFAASSSTLPAVPPTFAALVEERLAALPEAAADVLRAAAVLGADPPWALLPEVTGLREAAVLTGLRAASEVGLLVVDGGALRWRHALTCDAVAGTALPPERAAVARRAADALLRRGGAEDDVRAAELLVVAGEDERAAELLLRLARRDRGRGALRSAAALLDRVPPGRADAVAAERVLLLTWTGHAADALDAGERALASATGDAHAELCLRLARAAVRASRWQRAAVYVERAGRPDDPRTPLLAADAAFGAGDVARAAFLAAEAVAGAERAKVAEPLCEALELAARCALQGGDVPTADAAFARAASVAAEHGLLRQRVEAEIGRELITHAERPWQPLRLTATRDLALDAGMLAEVARIDLLRADGIWTAEGPAAAEPVAAASVELAATLGLTALQAVVQVVLAGILVSQGAVGEANRLVEEALTQPDRPPEADAYALVARALPALLAGDLARAEALMRPGVEALLGYPAAPPLAFLGLWTLLCAVRGDDGPTATLATLSAARRRPNRAALAYAEAVAAGRSGGDVAAPFAVAEETGTDTPWWSRLLRMVVLHAALADGWADRVDAVGALRADLAEHERAGDHQLARTCRDLLRRAGAPTRRGRGATPVPAALRAVGVTSREMDVLVAVADGLTNAQVAQRLFLSPRTVETHVANLLAKTGAANRAALRGLVGSQTP